jgi:deoxyribodipyrimidine photo-lyase
MDDNRTLAAATGEAGRVWPVFVADPSLLESSVRAPARLAWFAASLAALDARLRVHGSGLTVLRGHPELVLPAFATTVGAEAVFAGRDEDPAATGRDRRVAAVLDLRLIDDQRLVPPGEIRSRAGAAYTVFSGFLRALEARIAEDMEPLACPARPDAATLAPRPAWDEGPEAFVAPAPPHGCRTPGRRRPPGCCATSAVTRWRRTEDRDRPGLAATSGLSAHLRVGAISVRACWRAAIDAARSADEHGDQRLAGGATMWRRQLAWREFLAHVIAAHPRLATEGFRRVDDALEWVSGPEAKSTSRPGATDAPGSPSSMPACGSWRPPVGCTTAPGW